MAEEKEETIIDNISKLQQEYYSTHNKNILFKKNQKYDCANSISQQIDITTLFQKTIYILKEGHVFFDYTILKTYMHPEIYDTFLEYINKISSEYIDNIEHYTLHLNMNSLTISAFERYWPLINKIFNKFPVTGNKMLITYVYYTPNIADQILKILTPFLTNIKNKIVFYSKTESPEKIKELNLFIR